MRELVAEAAAAAVVEVVVVEGEAWDVLQVVEGLEEGASLASS